MGHLPRTADPEATLCFLGSADSFQNWKHLDRRFTWFQWSLLFQFSFWLHRQCYRLSEMRVLVIGDSLPESRVPRPPRAEAAQAGKTAGTGRVHGEPAWTESGRTHRPPWWSVHLGRWGHPAGRCGLASVNRPPWEGSQVPAARRSHCGLAGPERAGPPERLADPGGDIRRNFLYFHTLVKTKLTLDSFFVQSDNHITLWL